MILLADSLVFAPLPAAAAMVVAAVAALAWEWLRWGFLNPTRRGLKRRAAAGLMALPIAAVAWLLLRSSPLWAVPMLAGCGTVWAIRSYARTTASVAQPVKRLLLALRVAVIAVLAFIALRPQWQQTHRQAVRQGLAVLVDASRSMGTTDAGANQSRLQATAQAMAAQTDRLEKLAARYDLRIAGFDADLHRQDVRTLQSAGEATAIGDNLQRMVDAFLADGVNVAGLCVISDGNNNTSDLADPLAQAEHLAERGVSLWTFGVGSEHAESAALNVRSLTGSDKANTLDHATFSAEIASSGLSGQTVTVQCHLDEDLVGSQEVSFDRDTQSCPVRFDLTLLQPGFHRVSISAQPPTLERRIVGELSAAKLVHVLSRQVRVLYIEGRQRSENKFIMQALAGEERFAVHRWLLGSPLAQAGLTTNPDDPWAGYHVVLIGDCPASFFSRAALERLRDAVGVDGRGLAMLAGSDSFADGGWQNTPLAAALPVDLSSQGSIEGPIEVVPTATGLVSEFMRLGPAEQNAALWASLRPLVGASLMGVPKPAAAVLASSADGTPIIVAETYGAGRSLAVGVDTTWQWALSPDDTAALHERFWRQSAYWLANPMPNAWVATEQVAYDERRLAAGAEIITVTAGVEDSAGLPVAQADVRVTLTDSSQVTVPVSMRAEGDRRRAELPALPAGQFVLQLQAELEGKTLSAEHRFDVIRRDLEGREAAAQLGLLREMGQRSAAAGGGYRPLSELGDVLESFASERPVAYEQQTRTDYFVSDYRWAIIVLLLTLLIGEWAIRKKVGLI